MGSTLWNYDMDAAPKDGYPIPKVRALLPDGTVIDDAHWACDLSGEDQPAFCGWFRPVTDSYGKLLTYSEIEPIAWASPIAA